MLYFFNTSFGSDNDCVFEETPASCRKQMVENINIYIDKVLKSIFKIHEYGISSRISYNVVREPSDYCHSDYVYANSAIIVKESSYRSVHTGNTCRLGAFARTYLPDNQILGVLLDEGGVVTKMTDCHYLYYSFMLPTPSTRKNKTAYVIDMSRSEFRHGIGLIAFANTANIDLYDYAGVGGSAKPNLSIQYTGSKPYGGITIKVQKLSNNLKFP